VEESFLCCHYWALGEVRIQRVCGKNWVHLGAELKGSARRPGDQRGRTLKLKFQARISRLRELDHVYLCSWTYIIIGFMFLEIPKNCLVGDELPPGDAYVYVWFFGFRVESPGGTNWTARRCLLFNPILGFLDEELGGGDWPTRRRELLVRFFYSLDVLGWFR